MMNNDFPNIAKEYKRTIAGRFMLVEGAKLKDKISGEDFLVTKKMDGIMLRALKNLSNSFMSKNNAHM